MACIADEASYRCEFQEEMRKQVSLIATDELLMILLLGEKKNSHKYEHKYEPGQIPPYFALIEVIIRVSNQHLFFCFLILLTKLKICSVRSNFCSRNTELALKKYLDTHEGRIL